MHLLRNFNRVPRPQKGFICIFLLALLIAAVPTVNAQTNGKIILTPPVIDLFPEISFYFDAISNYNEPITDLTPQQVQILEDGHAKTIELNKVQPGVQIILAMNNGLSQITSDNKPVFDTLRQSLVAWGQNQPGTSPDDFSLSLNTGVNPIRETDRTNWVNALANIQLDPNNPEADLVTLTQALDLATDPNPNMYMKRGILFITPVLNEPYLSALPNLADRAQQSGISIFVWLVNLRDTSDPQVSAPYLDLAQKSNGQLFIFTGNETLPDPNFYFDPIRSLYQVRYTSGITTAGDHHLTVTITHPDLQVTSDPQIFNINVLAPNPIFLDPPQQILRIWSKLDGTQTSALTPDEQTIQIMIEFPDGKERPIKQSRLFVDGTLMAQNETAPFDRLTWPLSSYEASGTHMLKVEVEDSLGMVQSTYETLVDVVVEPPKRSIVQEVINKERLTILGALLAAALILVLVILFGGRRSLRDLLKKRRASRDNDPLTQPIRVSPGAGRPRSAAAPSPTIPRPNLGSQSAPARMVRLSESGHPIPASAVLLNKRLFSFGRDPNQSSCVLDSPTVDPLHCRMAYTTGGQFTLYDSGSIAGTWVNYEPISSTEGTPLQHGDIIQIGRVSFRFELSVPPEIKPPIVISG